MLIWRGWGILAALIPIGLLVVIQIIVDAVFGANTYQQYADVLSPLGLLVGAAILWVLGRRLNGQPGRVMIDQATGQQVEFRRDHSLFFIKMEYWAVVCAVGAVGFFVVGLFSP